MHILIVHCLKTIEVKVRSKMEAEKNKQVGKRSLKLNVCAWKKDVRKTSFLEDKVAENNVKMFANHVYFLLK